MEKTGFILFVALITWACTAAPRAALAAIVASDAASNSLYSDGWQAGDNGGTGFSPWAFSFSGDVTQLVHPPQFIDTGPLPGNLLGAPAFALSTSDRADLFDTSEATRNFSTALPVGQTFSMDVDGSALATGGSPYTMGNTIQLFGSDGQERFGLFTSNQFNGDNWSTMTEVNTGITASSAFHFAFQLVSANTYNLSITPVGGGSPLFTQTAVPLVGTAGVGINKLVITNYGTGSSTTGTTELFFNKLLITSPGLVGDYNGNGAVESADYVVWRKTDGDNSQGYTDWQENFGEGTGATGGSAEALPSQTGVPEPATLVLLMFAAAGPCRLRGRAA